MNDGRDNLNSADTAISALRRERDALRTALERIVSEDPRRMVAQSYGLQEARVDRFHAAIDEARSLLSSASVPAEAQAPAASPVESEPMFAVGDVVRVTGDTADLNHRLVDVETTIVRLPENYVGNSRWSVAYCVASEHWIPGLWVHPRDLVLVRKAAKP